MLYILIALFVIYCLFNEYFNDKFNELDPMKKRVTLIGLIAILVAIGISQFGKSKEGFDVVMPDNPTTHIDLKDFFKFIENYQADTMDPGVLNSPVSYDEEEHVLISNNIRNLLNLLKVVSDHPLYRQKCSKSDEIVEISDHYNHTKVVVDLSALKLFMENDIVIDTNRLDKKTVNSELLLPMKAIKDIIGKISNTSVYWNYLHDNRFQSKYRGLTLNPHIIKM